ncbi:MAG: hypothetical protein JXQ71_03400 [Verrucomicrobia bacterium]|nr:hypothetical protein [Verrucomicrobiota bacterium]
MTATRTNSYLLGEFRYVDLPQPLMLDTRKTYALTMTTTANDGDLYHHFASFTGVTPSPSSLVATFLARTAFPDAAYPNLYPDGADGAEYRHPEMFRHRAFVGPNARLAPFRITAASLSGTDLTLHFPAGAGLTYRLETTRALTPPDWLPLRTGIPGANGLMTVTVPLETGSPRQFFRLTTEP